MVDGSSVSEWVSVCMGMYMGIVISLESLSYSLKVMEKQLKNEVCVCVLNYYTAAIVCGACENLLVSELNSLTHCSVTAAMCVWCSFGAFKSRDLKAITSPDGSSSAVAP